MGEAEMTVDAFVPNGDTARMKVLIISEEGDMRRDALALSYSADVVFFQRLAGEVSYIFPEDNEVTNVSSWRPHIAEADVIIIEDTTFISKIHKDFGDGKLILYKVTKQSMDELMRLAYWMNPVTINALRASMEVIDTEPPKQSLWQRLSRRFRA